MYKHFKEDLCEGKDLIGTIFLSSPSHLPSYLGIEFLDSGCQWSTRKIEYYIFQKQGWVWSAKSSI